MALPKFLADLNPLIYLSDNYVVLDFEVDTSHGDFGSPIHSDNQLLLSAYRLGPSHPRRTDDRTVARWGGEFDQRPLLDAIAEADFIVAHHAKYELGWLDRCGLDLHNVLAFDTALAEYVLLGNMAAGAKELGMAPMSISLDMACRRRGLPIKDPVVDILIGDSVNPVRIPEQWLEGRCKQDVETTEEVFRSQRQALYASGRLPVLYTRCLLTPVLVAIEKEGMALDGEAVRKEHAEYSVKLAKLEAEMHAFTGGINWRSPDQKGVFIYETLGFSELTNKRKEPKRTPKGKRPTNAKTLAKLVARTSKQKRFIELNKELGKIGAALSKNLDFFLGVVNERNETFYAELHQANTATNRLSSTGIPLVFDTIKDAKGNPARKSVQFQNFPRVFKRLFRAKRAGFLFGDPDGSTLEFRAAAFLGQDEQAIADIQNPQHDSHRFTASQLHNVSIDEVYVNEVESKQANKDSWRQLAKPDTFKPLYGGMFGTPEQERYYAAFRKRYPGIAAAQESWVDEVLETKQLTTDWGLRYYFPIARRSGSGYVNVTSTVYNYPIQALATAEIIPIAVVYLWHRIRELNLEDKIFIVNLVHDNAPCEIHPSAQQEFIELAKQSFTLDVYNYLERVYGLDFNVPLGVGIKIGTHWGSGDEQQFNIYRDGRVVKGK